MNEASATVLSIQGKMNLVYEGSTHVVLLSGQYLMDLVFNDV